MIMHYEGELIAVVAHDDYVGRVMRPLQETATAKTPPPPPPLTGTGPLK
jgi:hypothetical protein